MDRDRLLKPSPLSSLKDRAAALALSQSHVGRDQLDHLLTECCAARLLSQAEIDRVDRRIRSVARRAGDSLAAMAEVRRLVERSDQLNDELSELSQLIGNLQRSRDRLDRGRRLPRPGRANPDSQNRWGMGPPGLGETAG
jgi:predicted RNase H-like nuclease (RuvC/YqgF family)